MVRFRQRQKPHFFWQPLVILCPVVILAVLGFLSLRQDKIIAQHDAAGRAQSIADNLLPLFWSALTNADPDSFQHHTFQIDSAGRLLFPPPLPSTPSPQPLNFDKLTTNQIVLWQQAERADAGPEGDPSGSVLAIREFLDTWPPDQFTAIANYHLGLLLAKQNQWQDAAHAFLSVVDNFQQAISESGLPLARLAEFKLLEVSTVLTNSPQTNRPISPDYFCDRIIFDPSPLTPSFLSWVTTHAEALGLNARNDYWNQIWQEHQESRELYKSARSEFAVDAANRQATNPGSTSRFFWFNSGDENCLAIRFDEVPASEELTSWNGYFRPYRSAPESRRLKSQIDLQPESGKNRVTLQNEPARTEVSRAKPMTTMSGKLARNRMAVSDYYRGPAVVTDSTTISPWHLCRTESELGHNLFSLLESKVQVPDYFGLAINVAGRRLREAAPDLRIWRKVGFFESGGKGRKIYFQTTATNILASSSYSENGFELFKVDVYLTSPATLFQRQSDRTFWFGSLVAASAIAAFIGLLSAWRAFNRQQELTELKSNFVSSVSHELRAPIASVRLMAESLERGKVADARKQHEYFRFIGQECRRLSSLIENVLDFSRIEQGRKQYEFEPTDLLALVQQTVKLIEPYAAERQINLHLDLQNLQPSTCSLELSVDGRAIQQALVNLLDNAIKHSPNGQSVTIVLELINPAPSGHAPVLRSAFDEGGSRITHHVHLSVIDHGPGIPPEEHEKIFERFYRLGSELRRETQGVGIGLSIVKHIVEAHAGRVLLQSAPGQGSRFTIELPMTNLENPPEK